MLSLWNRPFHLSSSPSPDPILRSWCVCLRGSEALNIWARQFAFSSPINGILVLLFLFFSFLFSFFLSFLFFSFFFFFAIHTPGVLQPSKHPPPGSALACESAIALRSYEVIKHDRPENSDFFAKTRQNSNSAWYFYLNIVYTFLMPISRWRPYWAGNVPDVINIQICPRFRFWLRTESASKSVSVTCPVRP